MGAASATWAGRRAAEALMLDAGKALRPTGSAYDPAADGGNGADVPTYADLDSGPCKVQDAGGVIGARPHEVGERTSYVAHYTLHRPADSTPLLVGDVWEMTAVSPLSLSHVGDRFRVVGSAPGSLKTARRYEVEVALS